LIYSGQELFSFVCYYISIKIILMECFLLWIFIEFIVFIDLPSTPQKQSNVRVVRFQWISWILKQIALKLQLLAFNYHSFNSFIKFSNSCWVLSWAIKCRSLTGTLMELFNLGHANLPFPWMPVDLFYWSLSQKLNSHY
jgi:hypothetical protein